MSKCHNGYKWLNAKLKMKTIIYSKKMSITFDMAVNFTRTKKKIWNWNSETELYYKVVCRRVMENLKIIELETANFQSIIYY